jgi:hypothetical protein
MSEFKKGYIFGVIAGWISAFLAAIILLAK